MKKPRGAGLDKAKPAEAGRDCREAKGGAYGAAATSISSLIASVTPAAVAMSV